MANATFQLTMFEGNDEFWEEVNEDPSKSAQAIKDTVIAYFEDRGWSFEGPYKNIAFNWIDMIEDDGQIQMNL